MEQQHEHARRGASRGVGGNTRTQVLPRLSRVPWYLNSVEILLGAIPGMDEVTDSRGKVRNAGYEQTSP